MFTPGCRTRFTPAFRTRLLVRLIFAAWLSVLVPVIAEAQKPTTEDAEELAKKLSNPISDLVSVPFQFNWY